MGRKPRVDRSPEEKWQIVQEGIKSGNVSETCRNHMFFKHGTARTSLYWVRTRWWRSGLDNQYLLPAFGLFSVMCSGARHIEGNCVEQTDSANRSVQAAIGYHSEI
jgi:transposase-like protein